MDVYLRAKIDEWIEFMNEDDCAGDPRYFDSFIESMIKDGYELGLKEGRSNGKV